MPLHLGTAGDVRAVLVHPSGGHYHTETAKMARPACDQEHFALVSAGIVHPSRLAWILQL